MHRVRHKVDLPLLKETLFNLLLNPINNFKFIKEDMVYNIYLLK